MTFLPNSGPISMSMIRNAYYGGGTIVNTHILQLSTSNANLMRLGYYRGIFGTSQGNTTAYQLTLSSGPVSMSAFYSTRGSSNAELGDIGGSPGSPGDGPA